MKPATARTPAFASGTHEKTWNTCGISSQTSISASTPAWRARSCARTESSSSISVEPAWNSSGGSPFQFPNSGDSNGFRRSWPGQYTSGSRSCAAGENIGSAFALYFAEGADIVRSVDGESSAAQSGIGSSASRARIIVTSDRLPPAESPASANGRSG